jgi:Tol biopolymer transport system component
VVAALAGLFLVAALLFGVYRFISSRKVNAPLAAMKITRLTNNGVSSGGVISPDGKYVAHVFTAGDQHSLRLRQTATSQSRDIVPLTDAYLLGVTFSPDGNFLYYVKGGRGQSVRTLYQVSVLGGDPRQLIYDVDSAVTFSPDGKKMAFIRGYLKELRKALFIANVDGTGEEQLTQRRAPEFSFMESPAWSPDGSTVAFIVGGNDSEGYFVNIDEINVVDRKERKITSERWRDITSIAWLNESSVLAVARDRSSIAGSPDQIWKVSRADGKAERVTNDLNYYIDVSVAADSHTLTATVKSDTSTIWIADAGNLESIRQVTTSNLSGLDGLAWTPDGRIVYTTLERDNRDIWIMNADGSNPKQLTFENSGDLYPSVSPDGRYIAFVSNRGVGWGIWKMNVDGSNQTELVANTEEGFGYPEFTADSENIIFSGRSKGKQVLFKVPIAGGQPVQLTEKPIFNQVLSPDRHSVLYHFRPPELDSKQTMEIITLDGSAAPKTLMPLGDGSRVQWAPDGKFIDYVDTRAGVSNLWRRSIDGNSPPKQLSDWKQDLIFRFAWSFDGKQVACARGVHASDVVLIENLTISD